MDTVAIATSPLGNLELEVAFRFSIKQVEVVLPYGNRSASG